MSNILIVGCGLIGSSILFIMFLLAMNRFEQDQLEKDNQDS